MWYGARRRAALRVVFFFVVLGGARAALADEGEVSVRVDCPGLSEEQRAALESRAKTELLVRRERGTLLVSCRAGAADVRWQPQVGQAAERQITLAPDAPATQEQVLEALELLLSPAPSETPLANAPPETAPPAAPPKPPARPRVEPSRPAPLAPLPSPEPPRASAETPFVEVLAGAAIEVWSAEAAAALGPEARAILGLPAGWAVSAGAQAAWTLRAPSDVAGRLVRGQLGAEYHLGSARRIRFGASLLIDWLTATRSAVAGSETDHDLGFGGLLAARYVLLASPLRLALGPTLSVRPAPIRVEVGDSEIFRIPVLAIGASAELLLGPL